MYKRPKLYYGPMRDTGTERLGLIRLLMRCGETDRGQSSSRSLLTPAESIGNLCSDWVVRGPIPLAIDRHRATLLAGSPMTLARGVSPGQCPTDSILAAALPLLG